MSTMMTPTRIVAYDEGDGEWTIEAADDAGTCLRDASGDYVACWFDREQHDHPDEFRPLTLAEAVAVARAAFADIGLPADLPVYVHRGDSMEAVEA